MGAFFQQEVHRQDEIILRPFNDCHSEPTVNYRTGAFILKDPLATRRENASVRRIVQVSQTLRHHIEYAKTVWSGALQETATIQLCEPVPRGIAIDDPQLAIQRKDNCRIMLNLREWVLHAPQL